jgi:hypothetical protein
MQQLFGSDYHCRFRPRLLREGWSVNVPGIDNDKAPALVRGLGLWATNAVVVGSIMDSLCFW